MRTIIIFCFLLIFIPALSQAEITFDTNGKWSTTFDESNEWKTGEVLNCDGLVGWGSWDCSGTKDQITSEANRGGSDSGKGFRHWVGDGTNVGGGGIRVYFPSEEKEVWVRWYMRYAEGFKWSYLNYDKILYFEPTETNVVIPEFEYDRMNIYVLGGGGDHHSAVNGGWPKVYPGGVSDGSWHVYEVHIKLDTDGTDGVAQCWIDGELVIDYSNIDYPGSGWDNFGIGSNQASPANGGCMPVDFDDIVIYRQTPPNTDTGGNPFIGPMEEKISISPSLEPMPIVEGLTVTPIL